MRTAVGPLDRPEKLEAILRRVFVVDPALPAQMAGVIEQLAIVEKRKAKRGALVSRMRRLRYLDLRRSAATAFGPSASVRTHALGNLDWISDRYSRRSS